MCNHPYLFIKMFITPCYPTLQETNHLGGPKMELQELYESYFHPDQSSQPYTNENEYQKDLFCFLDILLTIACSMRGVGFDQGNMISLENIHLRGISIGTGEVANALESSSLYYEDIFPRREIKEILLKSKHHIKNRLDSYQFHGGTSTIADLQNKYHITDFEQLLFLLALANYYDEKYELIFAFLQGDVRLKCPTIRMAASLYSLYGEKENGNFVCIQNPELFDLLFEKKEIYDTIFLAQAYMLRPMVYHILCGKRDVPQEISAFVTMEPETDDFLLRPSFCNKVEKIITQLIQGKQQILSLFGVSGIGKLFAVREAGKRLNKLVWTLDLHRLADIPKEKQEQCLEDLSVAVRLLNIILCVDASNIEDLEKSLLNIKATIPFFILLTTEKPENISLLKRRVIYIPAPSLTIKERLTVWKHFTKEYSLSNSVNLELLSNQFHLSIKGIRDVLWNANLICIGDGRTEIETKDLVQSVKSQSANLLGESARLIPAVYTWDDLILPQETKGILEMICNQVKYRSMVYEEWGFREKNAYGTGVSALLYGVPGTGKTMAVQVIANELGLPLYRVDLSMLVSKYIGETEKNISKIFHNAKDVNAVLFFDEADSLFAKRSEVKDSHDRNANAQTAHLLQEIESYDGITILATNYVNNIDDAFKRRIKFMVKFQFPSEAERLEMWKSMVAEKAPKKEELSYEFFAEKFELSGSNIKEIIVSAAYLAAADGSVLDNRYIVQALKMNYSKYGKILEEEDFDEL